MPDADRIRRVYDRYPEMVSKGDVEGILELYADSCSIEDPVGSEPHLGRDAVRAFYQASAGTITMKRRGAVCIAGNEAATPFVVLLGPEGERRALDIVSIMSFDDDGRITSMRAYWSFDAIRPATPDDLQ